MDNKTRFKMTLFIVLFLLLIAVVIYIVTSAGTERDYYAPAGTNISLPTLAPQSDSQEDS